MTEIHLTEVGGMSRLSGTDQHGKHWDECWSDSAAKNRGMLRCSICGEPVQCHVSGWICSESGEVRCDQHINY